MKTKTKTKFRVNFESHDFLGQTFRATSANASSKLTRNQESLFQSTKIQFFLRTHDSVDI